MKTNKPWEIVPSHGLGQQDAQKNMRRQNKTPWAGLRIRPRRREQVSLPSGDGRDTRASARESRAAVDANTRVDKHGHHCALSFYRFARQAGMLLTEVDYSRSFRHCQGVFATFTTEFPTL
jgi:hypothetical protein